MYAVSTMQGWKKQNEDTYIIEIPYNFNKDENKNKNKYKNDNLNIFGIFDGHYGREISEFVSENFTNELFKNKNLENNLELAIKETFIKMDELMKTEKGKKEIKNISKKLKEEYHIKNNNQPPLYQINLLSNLIGEKDNENNENIANFIGCCVCICIIDINMKKIYYVNLGDSKIVIYNAQNAISIPKTKEHLTNIEEEKNRINKAQGWISDNKIMGNLKVTRSLGDLNYKNNKQLKYDEQIISPIPDIVCEDFENIDFIIMGSNGFWDGITNEKVCDYFNAGINEKELVEIIEDFFDDNCSQDLYDEKGIRCDNMTCIFIIPNK